MADKIKNVGERIWKDVYNYRLAILIFAVYYVVVHLVFHAFCPAVLVTGFPCAGCGMTRAVLFMLTGQFARSWRLNPMAFPVIAFILYCVVERYILGKRVKGFKTGICVLCVCMLVVYVYRMCTIFPNRPPYVYTTDNLLERCVPFYRDMLHRLLGI